MPDVTKDGFVTKPQHPVPLCFKLFLSLRIVCGDVWLVMHRPIELDNKAMLVAVEVDDETSDNCLPPELRTVQLAIP